MKTAPTNTLDLYAQHTRQLAREVEHLADQIAELLDRPAAHDARQAAGHLDQLADLLTSMR